MDPSPNPITQILQAVESGDAGVASDLLPLLYRELRHLARSLMRKLPPGQTLQPTALVHEAYLKLVGSTDPGWEGRGHFFGAAARAMRQILVDQARRKAACKRGGGRRRVQLGDDPPAIDAPREDMLALEEVLRRLEEDDPRHGEIVNLRFFAGLSVTEVAEVLHVSEATVKREWRYIRAWLQKELGGARQSGG